MPATKNSTCRSEAHSSFSSYSSSSSDEEIDASDLKPIKEYLSNRKELARQLFKSVKPEKIRMMLPQVLKHMDFTELEEWCVSELSGMSKARIVSILNGKPMLESSDTSESEDSGPSLEIISDTEEWTDDDMSKKGTDKGKKKDKIKLKGKARSNNKKNEDKTNVKLKTIIKSDNSTKDVTIQKENDKNKEKEGDSLLDLLELEMRARAIRALIRKEEDIIPTANSEQTNSETLENKIKTAQDDAKAKENCRKQLERIISEQQRLGEDEDVVLVVQPTPIVELSSDSDNETCKKAQENQNAEKCTTETGKSAEDSNDNTKNSNKTNLHHSKENSIAKTDLNIKSEASTLMPERSIDIKNNTLSISISSENVAEKRKKSKKKSHTKLQSASTIRHSSKSKQISTTEDTELSNKADDTNVEQQINTSEENTIIEEGEITTDEKIIKKNKVEEEKSTDLDEIIELDDYCDVEIGNCEEDKTPERSTTPSEAHKQSTSQVNEAQTNSTAETWVSRYYQTDDVQNVIKESKIQSEIRKRLRERQRLSKLSKSPSLSSPSSQSSTTDVTFEKAPTGSVEEYLALKRAMNTTVNVGNDNTIQDNPAPVNLSDTTSSIVITNITAKESSVEQQDENTSSSQECVDYDAQRAPTSETTVAVEITEENICTETEVNV